MRRSRSGLVVLALCIALAVVCRPGFGQGQAGAPYKLVPVSLTAFLNDPTFDAFRQELAQIAQKKDRAGLARVVAATFFWIPEDSDIADKSLSPVDNLIKALGLEDTTSWEPLSAYADERTAAADPQRNGVYCSPADASYDQNAADDLFDETHTEAADWGFPVREGVEVRADAKADAQVIDRLGLNLVRMLSDSAGAQPASFVKVVTPLGNLGYAPAGSVLPLPGEQLCYLKDADGWKIAGFFGGEPSSP